MSHVTMESEDVLALLAKLEAGIAHSREVDTDKFVGVLIDIARTGRWKHFWSSTWSGFYEGKFSPCSTFGDLPRHWWGHDGTLDSAEVRAWVVEHLRDLLEEYIVTNRLGNPQYVIGIAKQLRSAAKYNVPINIDVEDLQIIEGWASWAPKVTEAAYR